MPRQVCGDQDRGLIAQSQGALRRHWLSLAWTGLEPEHATADVIAHAQAAEACCGRSAYARVLIAERMGERSDGTRLAEFTQGTRGKCAHLRFRIIDSLAHDGQAGGCFSRPSTPSAAIRVSGSGNVAAPVISTSMSRLPSRYKAA